MSVEITVDTTDGVDPLKIQSAIDTHEDMIRVMEATVEAGTDLSPSSVELLTISDLTECYILVLNETGALIKENLET